MISNIISSFIVFVILSTFYHPPVLAESGEEVYKERCAMCHGVDGKPTGIAPGVPDFSKGERLNKSDEELGKTISKGLNIMPAWEGILTEEERQHVLKFVRSLGGQMEASGKNSMEEAGGIAGKDAFSLRCSRCHAPHSLPILQLKLPATLNPSKGGKIEFCSACNVEEEMTEEEIHAVINYIKSLKKD